MRIVILTTSQTKIIASDKSTKKKISALYLVYSLSPFVVAVVFVFHLILLSFLLSLFIFKIDKKMW